MKNRQYEYKIGGNFHGLIPALFILALFGGVTAYLYFTDNGAFIFGAFLTALAVFVLLLVICGKFFRKILIYPDGFYYQSRPGNGRFYKFSEIKRAYTNESRSAEVDLNSEEGSIPDDPSTCYCVFETISGESVRFYYFLSDSEAVDYLIEHSNNPAYTACAESKSDNYIIDGKPFGITSIVGTFIIAAIALALEIPFFLNSISRGDIIGIAFSVLLFIGLIVTVVYAFLSYFCYKIVIGEDGFSVQTTPNNKKYYAYADIKSCKQILNVTRRGTPGSGHSGSYRRYYFFFTDDAGKTRHFTFQKELHGHEVDILEARIKEKSRYEVTENIEFKGKKLNKALKVLWFFIVLAFLGTSLYMMKNNIPVPTFKSSNNTEQSETASEAVENIKAVLKKQRFTITDKPVSFWSYDQAKLTGEVSAEKGDCYFEFYEYTDGETVDGVFMDIALAVTIDDDTVDSFIEEIPNGKIYEKTEYGGYTVIIYKDNTLIYASAPEGSSEIHKLLEKLGYIKYKD